MKKVKKIGIAAILLASVLFCSCTANSGSENGSPAINNTSEPAEENAGLKWLEENRGITADISEASEGDTVSFGIWEQDGVIADGTEELLWIVLKESEEELLLITKYCIEFQKYHFSPDGADWGKSTVRQWLNGEFLENAFNDEEKERIIFGKIETPENPVLKFRGGIETEDSVFLLSIQEAEKYFKTEEERSAFGVPKLCRDGQPGQKKSWWLRSQGGGYSKAAYIQSDGKTAYNGANVYDGCNFLRPAVRIKK